MARRPRLRIAGVPQHVIQRGNNRQATFFAEEDYGFYLESLQQAARKHECANRDLFSSHFEERALTEIRGAINCGWPLGSERFKD